MAIGESYEQLLEKLKPKKSTDDCHTPDDIYDKVKEQLFEGDTNSSWRHSRRGCKENDTNNP